MRENFGTILRFLRHARIRVLVLMAMAACAGQAQTPSAPTPSQAPSRAPASTPAPVPFERFAIGLRMGALITKQVSVGEGTERVLGNPILHFSTSAEAQHHRWVWGGTAGLNVTPRFGVNVDVLRRKLQFEHTVEVEAEDLISGEFSFVSREIIRTETRYWEIPVLVRYYFNGPGQEPRFYLSGGPVFRRVSQARAKSEKFDADFEDDMQGQITDTTPAIAQDNTTGAAASLGLQIIDDVGIKLELEGRFTRWLSRSVAVGSANSSANQAEIIIGFTF